VRLVAVSKTVPVASIREAIAAGQTLFGENRVQEALAKIGEAGPDARWHLIGHLQTNKAKHAAGAFELIHGVDDRELAMELDRRAGAKGTTQPVLVQVNLAGEPTKAGAGEAELLPLVEAVAGRAHLELRGLMIIPPPADDPETSRPWFRRVRELRDRAASHLGRELPDLSMGMTDDFEVAVEEGATLVRVGRAVFGERS
jgi:pyridoxal phosphate enzyme (YggS family)